MLSQSSIYWYASLYPSSAPQPALYNSLRVELDWLNPLHSGYDYSQLSNLFVVLETFKKLFFFLGRVS